MTLTDVDGTSTTIGLTIQVRLMVLFYHRGLSRQRKLIYNTPVIRVRGGRPDQRGVNNALMTEESLGLPPAAFPRNGGVSWQ